MQYVGIATPPANYASRLQRMFPGASWDNLILRALDPTDLALTKIERNFERDREDLLSLARAGLIDPDLLSRRYFDEVRPYLLARHDWHDATLELWLQIISSAR